MKLPPGYVPGVGLRKASAYGGVGERLLKGMGWQDGEGLGRSKSGMKSALEVKRKEDTAGVCAWQSLFCLLQLDICSPCVFVLAEHESGSSSGVQRGLLKQSWSVAAHGKVLCEAVVAVQVGTHAGYAWENKWWEAAFDNTAQALQEVCCPWSTTMFVSMQSEYEQSRQLCIVWYRASWLLVQSQLRLQALGGAVT